MVLTSFECWAHGDSNTDTKFSSPVTTGLNVIGRQYNRMDVFNPNSMRVNYGTNDRDMQEGVNEHQSSSVVTHATTNNSNDQRNVSHLSSNGYYGFVAQNCNVDTNNVASSETSTSRMGETIADIEEGISNRMYRTGGSRAMKRCYPATDHSSMVMNGDCITTSASFLESLNATKTTNDQQQMDVEQQLHANYSDRVNSGSSLSFYSIENYRNQCAEREKRFFVEEDNFFSMIDQNAKRFRSCGQQHFYENQGGFSSISTPNAAFVNSMDHDDFTNTITNSSSSSLSPREYITATTESRPQINLQSSIENTATVSTVNTESSASLNSNFRSNKYKDISRCMSSHMI